jgi:Mg2+ and Co2+ transporter CorA
MNERVYRLNKDRYLEACSLAEVRELVVGQDAPHWIDINHRAHELLAHFLTSFDIHPLAVEACLDPAPMSRFVSHGKTLFIGLPIRVALDVDERHFFWIVCLPSSALERDSHVSYGRRISSNTRRK